MAKDNNGMGTWVRWVLGFIILGLIAVAAAVAANRVTIAEQAGSLIAIEKKVDLLVKYLVPKAEREQP